MKKTLLFLVPVAALLLAGCSSSNPDTPTTSGDPTSLTPTTVTPYTPVHAGTAEDPLDANDAYNIASRLAESGSSEKIPTESKYYIRGVVTSLSETFNPSYGNFTFVIGGTESPFTGYRLLNGEAKEKFTSADELVVGDTVTMYSDIINFHGTMETNDGYIVSIAKAVTGVSLDFETKGVIKGSTTQLVATVAPETAANKNVTWSVKDASPEGCVTVDQDGTVHGVEVGTAKVVVTTVDGAKTAECAITVTASAVHVTSITLSEESVDMYVGGEKTLTATVLPVDATDPSFTWSIENVSPAGSIAVSNAGVVTSTAPGTAKVVVTTTDGGLKDECTITSTYEHGTIPTDPLTFAEAYEIADGLDHTQTTWADKQYYVSAKTYVYGTYTSTVDGGKATFWFKGTYNEVESYMQVYQMSGVDNRAVLAAAIEGDRDIVIAGGICSYYKDGNVTYRVGYKYQTYESFLITESTPTGFQASATSITIRPTHSATFVMTTLPVGLTSDLDINFSIKSGDTIGKIASEKNVVTVTTLTGAETGAVVVTASYGTFDPVDITVTFSATADLYAYTFKASSLNNAYANTYDVRDIARSFDWNIPGNQYEDGGLRIGGKSLTNANRIISTRTPIAENVTSVSIETGAKTDKITVNSLKLEVYSTLDKVKAGGTGDVASISGTYEASSTISLAKTDSADWSNCYYAIVFNVSVEGSSNKFVRVVSVTFSDN